MTVRSNWNSREQLHDRQMSLAEHGVMQLYEDVPGQKTVHDGFRAQLLSATNLRPPSRPS